VDPQFGEPDVGASKKWITKIGKCDFLAKIWSKFREPDENTLP
jgi:hypothetical protein